jgi:hypothetical protein
VEVNLRPFAVSPAVMSSLVKNLHLIQPGDLFNAFTVAISNVEWLKGKQHGVIDSLEYVGK